MDPSEGLCSTKGLGSPTSPWRFEGSQPVPAGRAQGADPGQRSSARPPGTPATGRERRCSAGLADGTRCVSLCQGKWALQETSPAASRRLYHKSLALEKYCITDSGQSEAGDLHALRRNRRSSGFGLCPLVFRQTPRLLSRGLPWPPAPCELLLGPPASPIKRGKVSQRPTTFLRSYLELLNPDERALKVRTE